MNNNEESVHSQDLVTAVDWTKITGIQDSTKALQYLAQMLYRYACTFFRGDEEAAADATQDIFIEILKHPERFNNADTPNYFLLSAFQKRMISAVRNRIRRIRRLQSEDEAMISLKKVEDHRHGTPETKLIDEEIEAEYARALAVAELFVSFIRKPSTRQMIDLHFKQNLTWAEIGERLKKNGSTVSHRCSYQLASLQDQVRQSMGWHESELPMKKAERDLLPKAVHRKRAGKKIARDTTDA